MGRPSCLQAGVEGGAGEVQGLFSLTFNTSEAPSTTSPLSKIDASSVRRKESGVCVDEGCLGADKQ